MTLRTVGFVVLSVVAASAVGFAQSNDDPLQKILQAPGVIGAQTTAIEGQVSDQKTGLPAVQGSLQGSTRPSPA